MSRIKKILDSFDLTYHDGREMPDGSGVSVVVVVGWVRKAKTELAAKDTAIRTALEWLDKFGAHAPISFGGEQELQDILLAALGLDEK